MVSKRFHLTIYRVLHEESESELKNDQILQPYAVFSIFRTRKYLKIYFLKLLGRFYQKNCIRLKDLVIFELGFGFLMQNSIYGQMETLGNHQMGLRTEKLKNM